MFLDNHLGNKKQARKTFNCFNLFDFVTNCELKIVIRILKVTFQKLNH